MNLLDRRRLIEQQARAERAKRAKGIPLMELSLTEFITLDGVYQAPGGPKEDPSKRLFTPDVGPTGLRLTDSRTTASGVLIATYRNAGAPEYGDYADET